LRFDADVLGPLLRAIADALGLEVRGKSDAETAAVAADSVARLVAGSGLPTRLRDVQVPESDLDALAEAALADGAIVFNGKFAADHDLVLAVFRQAY
jgi:alcohol dehydrogenase